MQDKAKININCNKIKCGQISPYIFGNFIEDMQDHMDAMLAYILRDMDFEEEDGNGDGVSGCWYPMAKEKNILYTLEPAAPKHSGHSQRIRIIKPGNEIAGIYQKTTVKGNAVYCIKMVARASMEIRSVSIEIADCASKEILCKTVININNHNWDEYIAELHISKGCENAEFRIIVNPIEHWSEHMSKGMIWIDHVSVLPQDRVGIINKEVFDLIKNLNCGMMRLGGNEISGYHWEHGVGPIYERPNRISEAWGHWANKYFGTDEFIKLCRDLSVEALICVNAGSGTPEEAAKWLEYCNGSIDTAMGALRAANGHEEPYGVKYWEIGNEIYGKHQIGCCSAEDYGEKYLEFYKAMKSIDKDIILLGCGCADQEWNKTVLNAAGKYMDYITIHIYHSYKLTGLNVEASREEKFRAASCLPEMVRACILNTSSLVRSSKMYGHVKLAFTEYNVFYDKNLNEEHPTNHSLDAAIANAGILNEFIRNADIIDISNYSDLVNGWWGGCIRVSDEYYEPYYGKKSVLIARNQIVYVTPNYLVLKLYANKSVKLVTECMIESTGFDVSVGELDSNFIASHAMQSLHSYVRKAGLENLPYIDAVSCLNENKNQLTVFIVNRSLHDIKTNIYLEGFISKGCSHISYIGGNSIDDINDCFEPERVSIQQYDLAVQPDSVEIIIKAHSIYAVEIDGKQLISKRNIPE